MKTLILLIAIATLFTSCSTPDDSEKESKEVRKRVDKILENARSTSITVADTVASLYDQHQVLECDLIILKSDQDVERVAFRTEQNEVTNALKLMLYSLDKEDPSRLVKSINIAGKTIGATSLRMDDSGYEYLKTSQLIEGDKGTLAHAIIRIDLKTDEILGSMKVLTLPTPEVLEVTETTTEWFNITNCQEESKEILKGL